MWWKKDKSNPQQTPRSSSLQERISHETGKLDEEERKRLAAPPPLSDQERRAKGRARYKQWLCRDIQKQTKFYFDIDFSPQGNPAQVEGMWLGLHDHIDNRMEEGVMCSHGYRVFGLFVPCPKCQKLRPAVVDNIDTMDRYLKEIESWKSRYQEEYNSKKKYGSMDSFRKWQKQNPNWNEFSKSSHIGRGVYKSQPSVLDQIAERRQSFITGIASCLREMERGEYQFQYECPHCTGQGLPLGSD